ncbi:hypothetical protein [Streptomyces sp. NPDC001594]|uniref:hypothetical protein n=1 Tax=Streptomyces sp. NPDC001594 TaxID=3364590 RepID=UPI0036AE89A4
MLREQGPGGYEPDDLHDPTWAEVEEEFGGPLAELADAPSNWVCFLERHYTDGFLYQVSACYHQGSEPAAVVSTARRVPESFRIRNQPQVAGELMSFLYNSGRAEPPGLDSSAFGPAGAVVNVNGVETPAPGTAELGCTSVEVAAGNVSVFVTASSDLFQEPPLITLGPPLPSNR